MHAAYEHDDSEVRKMEAGARYACVKNDQPALEVAETSIDVMKRGVMFPGFENDMRIFVSEDVFPEGNKLQPPSMVIHDSVDPMAPVAQIDWFCDRDLPVNASMSKQLAN